MDRTRLKARQFDRERARYGPEGPLQFFEKKAGQTQDALLISIEGGWKSESERRLGEVESTFVISITEQEAVTAEVISKASRALVGGTYCSVENWESPHAGNGDGEGAPPMWTVYAREVKPGAVRR
jgi:hypothetical protein